MSLLSDKCFVAAFVICTAVSQMIIYPQRKTIDQVDVIFTLNQDLA